MNSKKNRIVILYIGLLLCSNVIKANMFTQNFKKLFWGNLIFKGPILLYLYSSAYVLQQIINKTRLTNCPYSIAFMYMLLGINEANEAEKCNNLKTFNVFNPDQI